MTIEYLGTDILFEDQGQSAALAPALSPRGRNEQVARRRNAYFPGLAALQSGDLIALLVISEAFESSDATTYVARSKDFGMTWELEGALRDLRTSKNALHASTGYRLPGGRGKNGAHAVHPGSPSAVTGRKGEELGETGLRAPEKTPVISGCVKGTGENGEPGGSWSDYLKPTALRDGTVVAIGYRFERQDPAAGISIEGTGGILPGQDIISFSSDEGRTWTRHRVIPRSRPEVYEISGPCIELKSGDLVAVAAPFKMPDGGNPSGQMGILLRSQDRGRTWSDDEIFFRSPDGNLTPYESRICQMQDGRLAAIVWAYDTSAGRHCPNHVVVSPDDGRTWSTPIDTGHWGQASNLIWLGGDRLMTIHAHRGERPGIFVRLVDFKGDRWTPLEEIVIYGAGSPTQTKSGQNMAEMFASLKFGQPSLLLLPDGEILAVHWTVEDGRGTIRTHRLRLR
jgi:sialidase-1